MSSVTESITSAVASATSSAAAHASSSGGHSVVNTDNPKFKIVGICLAIGSGLFIGSSFVVKKKGLLSSTAKSGNEAGEGHAYLKSPLWWTGMTMMIVGEGWIGCTLCILGSIILALNAPAEGTVRTINEFKHLFIAPGFLVWASLCIIGSVIVVVWVAPRYGKKNMMPYISVCSLIGGISVSCTQGLGAAIITSIQGDSQVKNWFFWFLFIFVTVTLLVEINYLNKALELFNTSMVVPVYFCYFTSATMVTSFILYKGLKAPATTLVTMVLGFLVTCFGITLLQMSKVDPKQLQHLDRRSTLLLAAARHGTEDQEKGRVTAMEDPGMDALRSGFGAVGSVIRARSISRRMSTASSANGGYPFGQGSGHLNTHGLGALQRYQLSDNPMPDDELEAIPLSPAGTGGAQRDQGFEPQQRGPRSQRSGSTLKFKDTDVVHKYGYTRHDGHTDATHETRAHSDDTKGTPLGGRRQFSGSSQAAEAGHMEQILEPHDGRFRSSPEPEKRPVTDYLDPYYAATAPAHTPPDSPTTRDRGKLANLFQFREKSPKPEQQVRGGSHRGVRDYPHLGKGEEATEKEERAALVGGSDEERSDDPHGVDIGELGLGGPPTPAKGNGRRPMGPR
ncbi:hypothetical protein Q8F55_001779 [Vanrija albida]|uniref:DUF803-domain-containing protein n=1 Tax=Vanrija albida TaxID=181172 RepID=A0ABR3Q8S6_9TREE